jgi:hypothetical protein
VFILEHGFCTFLYDDSQILLQRFPSCGGAAGPLGGGGVAGMRDILIWKKYARKVKYVFWQALCLVEIFYLSLSTGTGFEL